MPLPILTEIRDRNHLHTILQTNPGKIVIKFGAEWCGPCKTIEPLVHQWMDQLPDHVQSYLIDVDECFDVYAFLKTKKVVNGIPAIICYHEGNVTPFPDDVVIGADINQVNLFFRNVLSP